MPVYNLANLEGAFKQAGKTPEPAALQQKPSPSPVRIPPARRLPPAVAAAYDAPSSTKEAKEERRYIPFLIPIILIANLAEFIITMYLNNCPGHQQQHKCVLRWLHRFSFQPFQENPLLGPSSLTLQKMGGLERSLILTHHQGWRLLTSIWLHAGVFHILIDIIALLIIGIRLEIDFGAIKIGVIYLLSGIGGSLLSALFVENQIAVGASGALFGLLGATLSELLTNWSHYERKCASIITLILLLLINLGFGLMPHVDNFAHIGGFVVGFLLGFVLLIRIQDEYNTDKLGNDASDSIETPEDEQEKKEPSAIIQMIRNYKSYQLVCLVLSLILLLAFFTAGFVLLFLGIDANKRCSWCHYLSCVPTSQWQCYINNSNSTLPS